MITLKTNISKLKRHEIKTLNDCLLKVCKKELGSKKGLDIDYTKKMDCYGYYDPELKKIMVNKKNCTTIEKYVNVVIHEYRHSKQYGLQKYYLAFNELYGYWDNPFEVDARFAANTFRPIVWKKVKELYKKNLEPNLIRG
jgi:hypothetical protein